MLIVERAQGLLSFVLLYRTYTYNIKNNRSPRHHDTKKQDRFKNQGDIMLKKILLIVALGLCVGLLHINNSFAALSLSWTTSPDGNVSGTPETTLNVGNKPGGGVWAEADSQSPQISGVGAKLPTGYPGFIVDIASSELNTYDAYASGYWDVFVVALTEGDYYWNKTITDPVGTDSDVIFNTPSWDYWWGGSTEGGLETDTGSSATGVVLSYPP